MTQDELLELSMLSDDSREQQYADAYIQAISDLSEATGCDFTDLTPAQQTRWINTCHDLARVYMICKSV